MVRKERTNPHRRDRRRGSRRVKLEARAQTKLDFHCLHPWLICRDRLQAQIKEKKNNLIMFKFN